jgi:predicted N-acetyltransferase YhbS
VIPEVAGWLHNEWGHLTPGSSLERTITRLRERTENDTIPLAFVALEDDQPVGTISLVPHDMEIRMNLTPWIASVFVKSDARNRGIGSQLMHFAEEEFRRLGFTTIFLFTPNKQRMYARLGWQQIEDVEYRGEQVSIMKKDLPLPETSHK